MIDLPAANYTWASVAFVLIAAVTAFFSNRAKRKQNYFKKIDEARMEYRKALEDGTPEQIMLAKKRYEKAKKALGIAVCLLSCVLASSCLSNHETILPVGDYVKIVSEGDVVPSLPSGEKRWMLLSVPTGADLVLEKD